MRPAVTITVAEAPTATDAVAPAAAGHNRRLLASSAGVLAAGLPFLLTLWDYRVDPLRTALPSGLFSNFYEIQADAFRRGDLAVPAGSLGIEGFRHQGHEYTYFGPFPALLRLPLVAFTDALDGRLTAPSMLLAWVVAAIFVSLIVWRVRELVTPGRALGTGESIAVGAFIFVVLGGSPLLLLAATPWVYTEALMWAFAMTVAALSCLLGVLLQPTWLRILATGLFTLGAVLSRVTAGWGCGLAVIGVGVLFAISPARRAHRPAAGWVIVAGAIPLGIGIAINVAKFGHPYMIPFDEQVWTAHSTARRAVLADGGVVGLRFLPTTLFNYLRPDGIRLSPVFPFLSPPAEPASPVGGVLLEMRYRTSSATAFMPALFVLGLVGAIAIGRRGAAIGRASLRIPLLGAVVITAGMLLVGYLAPRYIVEFLPALVIAGAAGLFVVLARMAAWGRPGRTLVAAGATALALFGASSNAATALTSARLTAGGSALRRFVELQMRVSDRTGRPLDRRLVSGTALPTESSPDELFIADECHALLVGTGELYEPWILLDVSSIHARVTFTGAPGRTPVDVVRFDGTNDTRVTIEFRPGGEYRVMTVGTTGGYTESTWRPIARDTTIDVDVRASMRQERYVIDIPGYVFTEAEMIRQLPDPRKQVVLARAVEQQPGQASPVTIVTRPTDPSPLCASLLNE
jgi:hypothetical protein